LAKSASGCKGGKKAIASMMEKKKWGAKRGRERLRFNLRRGNRRQKGGEGRTMRVDDIGSPLSEGKKGLVACEGKKKRRLT